MDKRTQKRTLRDGAKFYKQICERFARKPATGGGASGSGSGGGGALRQSSSSHSLSGGAFGGGGGMSGPHSLIRGSSSGSISGSQLNIR